MKCDRLTVKELQEILSHCQSNMEVQVQVGNKITSIKHVEKVIDMDTNIGCLALIGEGWGKR